MLKIKDNVDLKKIKELGLRLKYTVDEDTGEVWIKEIYYKSSEEGTFNYSIKFDMNFDEELCLSFITKCGTDVLYDLIKDGLVEKVED